ncbi:Translation elongation factor 1 beta [Coemansia thaxteri]|uniref:Translation elongation factor 1 beta n=1 Tax=Coemansia thaxteri TaxID=2663907 RepID=A0A9W8BKR8_9FUNG|nr:Translation elongation factor 1 beta [Coemansia thaxteri]KAJ2004858.1 Translation elongation factor 1 beta [Coemansia thaxteri]KAJ2473614.1 Translation elongation factor 1 beta [Coemansia sp. RSA 2322]KAJ2487966.1 Translation elongation factor 1 beta [Coemansia sp. RSA 2320]
MSVTISATTFNTVLNGFFEDNSFVSGVEASTADAEVYKVLSSAPDAKVFPHLARWYKNIASLGSSIDGLKAAEAPAAAAEEEDDDMDLFGSDDEEEDAEMEKIKAQRLAEYNARKATKGPGPAAKSMVTFDVKPWEAETDLDELEKLIRTIEMDGLLWAQTAQRHPIAFGVNKIRIAAIIEDAKVSTDDLSEQIEAFDEHVQSVDIFAFNKL